MNAIQAIAYANGAIRNAQGKLLAFYDAESGNLDINGHADTFKAMDLEHAMDLVGQHAKA